MDVFEAHRRVIDEYRAFTSGYVRIRDDRLRRYIEDELDNGVQWPEPWLSLNPAFAVGGTVAELVSQERLHPECERVFRVGKTAEGALGGPLTLHRHQADAIDLARSGRSYVLTTGTGSGKSLAYVIPIVDAVLRAKEVGESSGVKAIVVYPMNALANSQMEEMRKFLQFGYPDGEPVTFERYTGQESEEDRRRILQKKPDILLTNYVMLDLVLTRPRERHELIRAAQGLRFLVLDELHTYRGRQGADVAYLVRRVRDACTAGSGLQCIGTSATMSNEPEPAVRAVTVAGVASRIFGADVTPSDVIGETLVRATTGNGADVDGLRSAVAARGDREARDLALDTAPYDKVAADPLAAWIEQAFGLKELDEGVFVRQDPTRVQDAARRLAEVTGRAEIECERAIRYTLVRGSSAKDSLTGRPLFAFRLHQFLSKGDTPHVTLEPPAERYTTVTAQLTHPDDPARPLYPLSFCRQCGQEYLQVDRVHSGGNERYLPRGRARRDLNPRLFGAPQDAVPGYLFVSDDMPWPGDPIADSRYPESWIDDGSGMEQLAKRFRDIAPRRVNVAPDGTRLLGDSGLAAAFVPSFRFCLRCRTAYEQARGSEYARLATLDREGRSSAVTVVASATVRALRAWDALPEKARKLLTFVDNRQDASLQSGHFNDFVQVVQLRGALYRALRDAAATEPDGVPLADVAALVVRALGLRPVDFMDKPEAAAMRGTAERALREVIHYRVLVDLERGWKITLPNLEQSGLLRVDYLGLSDVARDDDAWSECHRALADAEPAVREEIARVALDEFRRVLAVEADALTVDGIDRIGRRSRDHLREVWSIGEAEALPRVGVVTQADPVAGRAGYVMNLGGRGALGRWLVRRISVPHLRPGPSLSEAPGLIEDLLDVLDKQGYLEAHTTVVNRREVTGYRLRSGTILLVGTDNNVGAPDPLRVSYDGEGGARVLPFFQRLYRDEAASTSGLHSAEHTAQVSPEQRQQREIAFRSAEDLNLLFCSPTMELGVDIAELNAVMMRNVPPTPANYVQRSGRAGRSGQQALVTTYCATGNSHDQYYFRRSQDMVAGSVSPPRVDLANPDLVRSHIHAVWLGETGADLGSSMADIIDLPGPDDVVAGAPLPLRPDLWRRLTHPDVPARAARAARSVLGLLAEDELARTTWFDEGWVERVIASAAEELNAACGRWRSLYREAMTERARAHTLVLDRSGRHSLKEDPRRRRAEAEQSLALLLNEAGDRNQSDFYTYRYLAGEGFLPGYSFPRLPLAAFIPGRTGRDGEYIQRPRFLAISEFGPRALIYHEGARYEVTRVQLPRGGVTAAGPAAAGGPPGGLELREVAVCRSCSYHHTPRPGLDRCEACDAELPVPQRHLMRMQTVRTRRRERISADEEERNRIGFELRTTYRFAGDGGTPRRIDARWLDADDAELCAASFGDSAEVRVTNLGRRIRKIQERHGFIIDAVTGKWLPDADEKPTDDGADGDSDGAEERIKAADEKNAWRVVPFVEDTRNVLILRWGSALDVTQRTSLQFALERAMEVTYQLEDSELSSEPLDDDTDRGRTLFVESAEGGAGVLRRIVTEPDALATVARQALRLLHHDPDTGDDLGRAEGAREPCGKACYDCLLSYGNQIVHDFLDRRAAVPLLRQLISVRHEASSANATGRRQPPPPPQPAPDEPPTPAPSPDMPNTQVTVFLEALLRRGRKAPDELGVTVGGVRVDALWRLNGFLAALVAGPQWEPRMNALIDAGVYAIAVPPDGDVDSVLDTHESVLPRETAQ